MTLVHVEAQEVESRLGDVEEEIEGDVEGEHEFFAVGEEVGNEAARGGQTVDDPGVGSDFVEHEVAHHRLVVFFVVNEAFLESCGW